jgi:putative salt-induced outer membrane protein YdiY
MQYVKKIFLIKMLGRLVLLCSAGLSSSAFAIVSMESVHLGKPPQGFSGAFDLSFDADYGNTEERTTATGIKLQHTREKHINFVIANYEYGESSGAKTKNKSFAHYRHIYQRRADHALEGFAQLSSNEFTRLNLRALAGGGVRLALGETTEKSAFLLGLGAFYEREDLDVDAAAGEDETTEAVRGNCYLVLKFQFNDNVSLVSSTYYQPDFGRFSDFRAIEDLSLVSKLTERLALNIGLDISHDSEPPPAVDETDASIKVGLSVTF